MTSSATKCLLQRWLHENKENQKGSPVEEKEEKVSPVEEKEEISLSCWRSFWLLQQKAVRWEENNVDHDQENLKEIHFKYKYKYIFNYKYNADHDQENLIEIYFQIQIQMTRKTWKDTFWNKNTETFFEMF